MEGTGDRGYLLAVTFFCFYSSQLRRTDTPSITSNEEIVEFFFVHLISKSFTLKNREPANYR